MKIESKLKIGAAIGTILGIIFGFFELLYSPNIILTEDSPSYPDALTWLGWILASGGALAYIAVDVLGSKRRDGKMQKSTNRRTSPDRLPSGKQSQSNMLPKSQ
ncbi:MAG: hypothetical protein IPK15_20500 [Verrucomicrobia bacterium]|nr:hypothetical protein [Verrucomicrobiota bacterium]